MKSTSDPTAASPQIAGSPRKRWLKRGAIALVIYAVVGFLIVPAIVKWQLRKQLPALTQRIAAVETVRMNPFALSLTVRGLALTETNGTPFAAFDELYVNFQLSSIFRRAWTFGEIRLTHPTANVIRLADGSFNFSNLAPAESAPATNPPSAPPPLLIHSLVVTNAVISFADATTPRDFRSDYGPLHLALADFTTRPHRDGTYSFVVTTDEGESFSWAGSISINPLRSSGQFELRGIPPGKYGPYLAHFATVRVERGTLDLGAKYRVDASAQPLELEVTNATVSLRDLLVKPPDRDVTLLGIEQFQITNTWASLTGRVARVGLVELAGGQVFVSRETNGQPTLLNYRVAQPSVTQPGETNSPAPSEPAEAGTPNELPWRFDLDELSVTRFALALEDHSTAGVAELGLEELALNVKGVSNQSNAPLAATLSFLWRGGGSVNLTTRGTGLPPALDTSLAISNFALAPLQPYVGQHLNLTVHSGELSVAGAARFDPAAVPQIQFQGDVNVTNFNLSDTVAYHELSAWENLGIRGIEFSLQTNWLRIAEIKFTGARNHLVISSNGVLNLSALVKSSAPGAATNEVVAPVETVATNVAAAPFPLQIGAVVLERSSFRAADDSLYRSFETRVAEFDASVRDIVMPGLNQAQVDIRGKVSALAPFEIIGRVTPDPQNLFVDLKVTFTNTDLTSLSPYTEKYVGRPLTKGKLTTELSYHIENRLLTASNFINLDQLTLGARVESPDATKLPVKLAIGLLKDLDGQIVLDVPMSGSLDDPKFSIWGLVGQTMQNLILKVATSPFALLGALAGGGAELQFVDFDPGSVTLNDSQTNKLMKLSEALAKRPALSLEVGATFDPLADGEALGRQKVLAQMKAKRIEEVVARGRPAPALAELQLEPDDYERLLRQAYRTAFNTTPEQALREALAAALATNTVGEVSVPIASPTRTDTTRGATALMTQGKSLAQLAAAARAATTTNSAAATDAKPLSEKELVLDELERRLASQQPATPVELRSLMQKRIAVVQEFLVQTAGVAADRVLPTEPNPDDPQRRGLARVVFSLE
jgi:uncharacterized protein involved in outer membrane biogenesis